MECWSETPSNELRQFRAISILMNKSPHLLGFVFHPSQPQLRLPPAELLRAAQGFSSGDYVLIKLAVDLWCEQGHVFIHELFNLDCVNFDLALKALKFLQS